MKAHAAAAVHALETRAEGALLLRPKPSAELASQARVLLRLLPMLHVCQLPPLLTCTHNNTQRANEMAARETEQQGEDSSTVSPPRANQTDTNNNNNHQNKQALVMQQQLKDFIVVEVRAYV